MQNILPQYYSSRLNSLGIDLYKLITYLPYRLETISNNLNSNAEFVYLNGFILNINNSPKHSTMQFSACPNFLIYDFAKKIKYFKYKEGEKIQILISKSNNYYSLIAIEKFSEFEKMEIGHFQKPNYYRPVYSKLSFQIQTKAINKIHNYLPQDAYFLNLQGLVPVNDLIPQILCLEQIHKPSSINEYNKALYQFALFESFLNLAFLKNITTDEPTKNPRKFEDSPEIMKIFEEKTQIKLSNSQNSTIKKIMESLKA